MNAAVWTPWRSDFDELAGRGFGIDEDTAGDDCRCCADAMLRLFPRAQINSALALATL